MAMSQNYKAILRDLKFNLLVKFMKQDLLSYYSRTLVIVFCLIKASELSAVIINKKITEFVRLTDSMTQLHLSPKSNYLAFVNTSKNQLNILELDTLKIYAVFNTQVPSFSYFWANDGVRLFIRALRKPSNNQVISKLLAYDCYSHKLIEIEEFDFPTGLPTYDPSDLRIRMLHEKGIISRKIDYPGKRLAKWQKSHMGGLGFYLIAQNGVLWVSENGHKMRRLDDDNSSTISYKLSPDGRSITWETAKGRIFVSHEGDTSQFVDFGRDPSWHPTKKLLIYSGARMVGKHPISYDLKIWQQNGRKIWLTDSQSLDERWPQWIPEKNKILFTRSHTSDLFIMDFVHEI